MHRITEIGAEISGILEGKLTHEEKTAYVVRWYEEGMFNLLEKLNENSKVDEDAAFATALAAYWTGIVINQAQKTCQN